MVLGLANKPRVEAKMIKQRGPMVERVWGVQRVGRVPRRVRWVRVVRSMGRVRRVGRAYMDYIG
jgi:hypothetical protein